MSNATVLACLSMLFLSLCFSPLHTHTHMSSELITEYSAGKTVSTRRPRASASDMKIIIFPPSARATTVSHSVREHPGSPGRSLKIHLPTPRQIQPSLNGQAGWAGECLKFIVTRILFALRFASSPPASPLEGVFVVVVIVVAVVVVGDTRKSWAGCAVKRKQIYPFLSRHSFPKSWVLRGLEGKVAAVGGGEDGNLPANLREHPATAAAAAGWWLRGCRNILSFINV